MKLLNGIVEKENLIRIIDAEPSVKLYNNFELCVHDDPTFFTFIWCLEVAFKLPTSNFEKTMSFFTMFKNRPQPFSYVQWCKCREHCVKSSKIISFPKNMRKKSRKIEEEKTGSGIWCDTGWWRFSRRNYYSVNETWASNLKIIYGNIPRRDEKTQFFMQISNMA